VQKAQALGMNVMLKPHVDIEDGMWRAFIGQYFTSQEWDVWFYSYQEFISHYARLANTLQVKQFSVGVEYVIASKHQTHWRNIVTIVRSSFTGSITYAANWGEEIDQLLWADALDMIGVDAYYPLTNLQQPAYSDLLQGWVQWHQHLKNISAFWKKPMIFTEIGFKSINGAAIMPGLLLVAVY
jgi:hypothetical protein